MSPERDVCNLGPPDKERPGAIDSDRVNPEVGSSPKSPTTDKAITAPRQCRRNTVGLYASGWRDGFKAGAADALRVAGRHLPAETWPALEALSSEFDLAGGDE
jgi:hypothetical protein